MLKFYPLLVLLVFAEGEAEIQRLSKMLHKIKIISIVDLTFKIINKKNLLLVIGHGMKECVNEANNEPFVESQCLQAVFNNDYFWN